MWAEFEWENKVSCEKLVCWIKSMLQKLMRTSCLWIFVIQRELLCVYWIVLHWMKYVLNVTFCSLYIVV
jgi:hypothetical protein